MHAPHDAITADVEMLLTEGTSTHLELAELAGVRANEVACLCKLLSSQLFGLGSQCGSPDLITLAHVALVAENLASALSIEASCTVERLSESQDGVA
jgi:hypothetical protein